MMISTRRGLLACCTLLALFGSAQSTFAATSADAEAQKILDEARKTIADMGQDKDFGGLRRSLASARAVLVFPRIFAAGLVLGGSGGNGVLMVRNANNSEWEGPVFYTLGGMSVGLEAGAFNGAIVMVLQSEKALDSVYRTSTKLGADATVALGSKSAMGATAANSDLVVYSKIKGAFAGVAVDGVVLTPRDALNKGFYGKPLSPAEMVLAPASATPSADGLRQALREAAR